MEYNSILYRKLRLKSAASILSAVRTVIGDGIFGTNCVSAPVHTEAIGRDLAQGFTTGSLVDGCTAYVYSTPDCTGDSVFDVTGQYDGVCFNNDRTNPNVTWEIESAKIVCSN